MLASYLTTYFEIDAKEMNGVEEPLTPGLRNNEVLDKRVKYIDSRVKQLGFRFWKPPGKAQRLDAYDNQGPYLYISYYNSNNNNVEEISFEFDESLKDCEIEINYKNNREADKLENADIYERETWDWIQEKLNTQLNLGFASNVTMFLNPSPKKSTNYDHLDYEGVEDPSYYTWVESENTPLLYGDVNSTAIHREADTAPNIVPSAPEFPAPFHDRSITWQTSDDPIPSAPEFPAPYGTTPYQTFEPSRVERPASHTFAQTGDRLEEHIVQILTALNYQVKANRLEIEELKQLVGHMEKCLGGFVLKP